MGMLLHIAIFFIGCLILWKASGMVVSGIERFSKNLRLSSFATSFFILGILTSVTEISVGINSVLDGVPEVFVGNLIGGSFVIILLIIPFLAVFNKGVTLKNHLDHEKLLLFLFVILCPSLLILDGTVSRYDAILLISLYGLFFYFFQRQHSLLKGIASAGSDRKILKAIGKILFGTALIYLSAKILVEKTILFAESSDIPPFLISLLILSIGTNLPEIVIAVKSMRKRRPDIAFGDYVGSAAANPLIFGGLTLINGSFEIDKQTFDHTFFVILFGYVIFFLFAKSKDRLSASEGLILLLIFLFFVMLQTTEMLLAF